MWVSASMALILTRSQLGIKSVGTRVSRADRYGSKSSDSLSYAVAVCIS